jgi:hypothetical protein
MRDELMWRWGRIWFTPITIAQESRCWWYFERDNQTRLCPKFQLIIQYKAGCDLSCLGVLLSFFSRFINSHSMFIFCVDYVKGRRSISSMFIEYLSYFDMIKIVISYRNHHTNIKDRHCLEIILSVIGITTSKNHLSNASSCYTSVKYDVPLCWCRRVITVKKKLMLRK